jgi:hypothetical protein
VTYDSSTSSHGNAWQNGSDYSRTTWYEDNFSGGSHDDFSFDWNYTIGYNADGTLDENAMMAASASATNVVNGNYYGNSSGADGGTETYSGSSGGGSSSSWSNSYNGSWGDSYSETLNSGPGFYSGYYTGYGTSYYGGGPGVSSGPGGGGGPGQVIAYADGAPEVSAYAEGFQTSAGGPGVPSPGNGGIFNAGAAVSASTYPATRTELEIPTGVGPSTNPSPGGANNFNGVKAQQAAPGTPAATPTESNASAGGGQREGEAPAGGGAPGGGGLGNSEVKPDDATPGIGRRSAAQAMGVDAGDVVIITDESDGSFIITVVPNVAGFDIKAALFNGKTFEFNMPARGYNKGDFGLADEMAKSLEAEFPGFGGIKGGATWHHKSFDPETGTFLMQLVDKAEHADLSHAGGAAEFRDWVAKEIAEGRFGDMKDHMQDAVANALQHDGNPESLSHRFANALRRNGIEVKRGADGLVSLTSKSGEVLAKFARTTGKAKRVIGFVAEIGGKRIGIILTVASVALTAGTALAEGGDAGDVAVALAKDEFQTEKDALTFIFVGASEAVAARTIRIEGHVLKRFKALSPDDQRKIIATYRDLPTSKEAMTAISKQFGENGKNGEGVIMAIMEFFSALDEGAK